MDLIQVATAVCYKNLSPEPVRGAGARLLFWPDVCVFVRAQPNGTPTVLRDVLARCFQVRRRCRVLLASLSWRCLSQRKPDQRPHMREIVQMLA